jgi:hypothetical protein
MKIKTYILLLLMALMTVACSHIDESERLIYVKPEPAKRVVLLEDFTGQRCVNCPKGTEVIEQLQQTYGDSVFVAVGIHGGPLGFAGNASVVGLATPMGDEYYNHWHLEYQPVGLVNRHGAVNYTDWPKAVKEELAKPAPLKMEVKATLGNGNIQIELYEYGTDGVTTGKLQVWIVEDQITAMQLMPDGKANANYVHNHVLRAAVNGLWGDAFTIDEGEWKTQVMSLVVEDAWNPENLSVVAFVYNDQGVQQAVKGKVNSEKGKVNSEK